MTPWESALEEYRAALEEDEQAFEAGTWTRSIGARRIAATLRLHELEDPWTACRCETCCLYGSVSRETRENL